MLNKVLPTELCPKSCEDILHVKDIFLSYLYPKRSGHLPYPPCPVHNDTLTVSIQTLNAGYLATFLLLTGSQLLIFNFSVGLL